MPPSNTLDTVGVRVHPLCNISIVAASRSTNNDNQEFEVPCGDQTLDGRYCLATNGSVFTLVIAGKSPLIVSYFEVGQAGC